MALDKLQGENECYLGLLMQTIQQVKKKLISIAGAGCVIHVVHLLTVWHRTWKNASAICFIQFSARSNIYAAAAVCHPNFTLRWVPAEKDCVNAAFLEEARKCAPTSNPAEVETENMHISADDFFDFKDNSDQTAKDRDQPLRLP